MNNRRFYQISRTTNREQRAQAVAEILQIELDGGSGAADLFDAMCSYIIGHRNGQRHPARPQASGQAGEGQEG